MIKLLTIKNDTCWSETELENNLSFIPKNMITSILSYKDWESLQAHVLSKRLIVNQIKLFNLGLQLIDLKKDIWNKPFFDTNFHVSVSHSHQLVTCIAADDSVVGIDIERIDVERTEYPMDLFSENECQFLNNSMNINFDFYKLFTRKEALAKAAGKGVFFDFKNYDAINDVFLFENIIYYFKSILYSNNYMLSYLSISKDTIDIISLN